MNISSTLLKVTFGGAVLLGLGVAGGTQASADEIKKGDDVFYKVESGDTLNSIAEKYGTTATVVQANNQDIISNINLIHPDQEFLVSGDSFNKDAEQVDVQTEEVIQPETDYSYSEPAETYVEDNTYENTSTYTGDSSSAKEWIAQKESGGSYSATNGQYIGRYQLTDSYLNGDYSEANQERVADQYVSERYGSWENAQQFWQNNGWY